jgi:hypothetical protein
MGSGGARRRVRYRARVRVPGFLLRQLYVTGSLRNEPEGFSLRARNPLGDGTLVRIGHVRVDGQDVAPEDVTAQRDGDPETYRAIDVGPTSPVTFRRGDVVTFHVSGWRLDPGEHELELEVEEASLGRLSLAIRDRLAGREPFEGVPDGAPDDAR